MQEVKSTEFLAVQQIAKQCPSQLRNQLFDCDCLHELRDEVRIDPTYVAKHALFLWHKLIC